MIAVNNEREDTDWQTTFLTMLPELEKRLRGAFRFLDPEAREESLGRQSHIPCLLMFDCMNKAEQTPQLHQAWPGTARGK